MAIAQGLAERLPEGLQRALDRGVLARLPLTFLPFVNQQLHEWEFLFPQERQSVERLLLYVAELSPAESAALFREVVGLEEKMDVRHWQFSTAEQTILNASELARSPYFQQWRQAVQAVFDASDTHAAGSGETQDAHRLVLLSIPRPMMLEGATAWRHWQGIGRVVALELGGEASLERLLLGARDENGLRSRGVLEAVRRRASQGAFHENGDAWVVEAGSGLAEAVLADVGLREAPGQIVLSYGRLVQYRENFSHVMNTMRKDLGDADAVFDRLRGVDVTPWCPAEVAGDAAVREFLRAVFLTGNGAVIFGNSFVEWAASEAFRRARPAFLAAQFGVRSKPKPFTGVAVFENPDQVNPLPAVDDLEGSAIDAQMLALYVWLAASRLEEYRRSAVCVCVAESLAQAYVVGPVEFMRVLGLGRTGAVSMGRLGEALCAWMG